MKILSLLPSATEIVYALGLDEHLAGVSSDCDHPAEVRSKPVVSTPALDLADKSPAAIDKEVRAGLSIADSLYELDRDLVRELQPDLILAQDLCRVCAVPSGHVTDALEMLGCNAEVISLDPRDLSQVLDGIEDVARATSVPDRGRRLVDALRRRIRAVRSATENLERISALALEWADPPFAGGHWIPEMFHLAGGVETIGVEGAPSRACRWDEVAAAAPEVIVFMPCGYGLGDAVRQARGLLDVPEFAATPAARDGRVWGVDGSSYFSRPGPRLVDGIEILAWIFHPELFGEPPPGRVERVPHRRVGVWPSP
jgi:iron complex transport system substrate-binding protein